MRITIAQMLRVVAGAAVVLAIAVASLRDPIVGAWFVAGPACVLLLALHLSVLSLMFLTRENRMYYSIFWLMAATVSAVVLFISLGIIGLYDIVVVSHTIQPNWVLFTGVVFLLAGVLVCASLYLSRKLRRDRSAVADSEAGPSSIPQESELSR